MSSVAPKLTGASATIIISSASLGDQKADISRTTIDLVAVEIRSLWEFDILSKP
jgi:hypothetical protein